TAFGVLNAVDDRPRPPFDDNGDPIEVQNKVTTVARVSRGLQRSDYVGGIFTHTAFNGRQNFVAGGDISFRPASAHSFSATVLTTRTTDRDAADRSGSAAQATYNYETRRWVSITQAEHY